MLLLGSTGRNSGKTILACAIIRHMSPGREIVGLKVTTIHGTGDVCPRGGEGCGVCASLEGEFCITTETDNGTGKDTEKMVEAGAKEVFWLRARAGHLEKAVSALRRVIPSDIPVVCESNSLRHYVEPGVFLVMKPKGSKKIKPSAQRVLGYADRVVEGDESKPGIDENDVFFENGCFYLRHRSTAVILAGGGSSRMGVPKSSLDYRGVPLIVHVYRSLAPFFSEVIVSVSGEDSIDASLSGELRGVKRVIDAVPGRGPIAGIAAGLEGANHDTVFACACDIPTINRELIAKMMRRARDYDIVVPRTNEGFFEPLYAVYKRSSLPAILELMETGERRIRMVYEKVKTCYHDLNEGEQLSNVNTPEEYLQI
jgi:molybdopterin-guanine dinucleotide biosynthesis protein A